VFLHPSYREQTAIKIISAKLFGGVTSTGNLEVCVVRLAESGSSLYTTSFPFQFLMKARLRSISRARRGCMGRLRRSQWVQVIMAVSSFLSVAACGGHKPPGTSPLPAKITLTPSVSLSLQMGATQQFIASAVNGTNQNVSPTFTYILTPNSVPGILDVSPAGFACGGTWNAPYYNVCTPGASGVVQVVASALGSTSTPTYVFVHPPVASIQISVVPPVTTPPAACPTQIALPAACQQSFTPTNSCLSQNQIVTLQASAFDAYGNDISALIGPFTWSQGSFGVATVTPIVTNNTLNVPTNQATVAPGIPGQTPIIASAAGVSGQPYYFETCLVQCINLNVSASGEYTGQTSFVANAKGGTETITATAVDVQGCIVPKPPLTWTSSQPASVAAGSTTTGCAAGTTCSLTLKQPGAAVVTASCTPPTCNIGFPLNPSGFAAGSIYIPQPVYPVTAISGLVTGATSATSVLATSLDCTTNALCGVALYDISTSKNIAASPSSLPTPPNSLIFDPAGDKAYMGSEFGAFLITASNLGSSSTSPYTPLPAPATTLGLVTGKVLAVSPTGTQAIFADNVSTPNQVYVVNTTTTTSTATTGTSSTTTGTPTTTSSASGTTPLNINNAVAAAFSPDGLKVFILGDAGNTLYIYSTLQALQAFPLTAPANAIAFSSSGSFALLSGGTSLPNLTIYNTCDNSVPIPPLSSGTLPGPPLFLKMIPPGNVLMGNPAIPLVLDAAGLDFFFGVDNTGIDIIATNASQGPANAPFSTVCPQPVVNAHSGPSVFEPVHIDIGQGTFHPINFFVSPDATQVYIVTSDLGVLVYSFSTQSVTAAIPLNGGAAPVAADMTVDGVFLYVAGTDNVLHELNTNQFQDVMEIPFTELPNSSNNFCYASFTCALNMVIMQP
jgi:hypothetical protein